MFYNTDLKAVINKVFLIGVFIGERRQQLVTYLWPNLPAVTAGSVAYVSFKICVHIPVTNIRRAVSIVFIIRSNDQRLLVKSVSRLQRTCQAPIESSTI